MAQNFVQKGHFINATPSYPASPDNEDPVVVGKIAGVAVTNLGEGENAATEMTIATRGIWTLPVVGFNGTTDTAVHIGDRLYYDTGDEDLNVNSAEVLYGKALEAIDAGATSDIKVLLIQA